MQFFRENIVFVAISVLFFLNEPAIIQAQTNPYNPINFTQTLNLSRGNLLPLSPESLYLSSKESCDLVVREFGWQKDSCSSIENIVFGHLPEIDTLILDKPNSDGYVKFDDWDEDTVKGEIDSIWESLISSSKEQSKILGYDITPIKWIVFPKLEKRHSYMYYAYLLDWDGEPTVNIKATKFDRRGYVAFSIVPTREDFTEEGLTRIVETTLDSYQPNNEESYGEFRSGEKIAGYGALGVLATLMGVKYGKAVATGLFAVGLILLKKLWFLLLLPFIYVGKLIFRK